MIPKYPHFKNIGFEDTKILNEHLHSSKKHICELNTANLLIWKDYDRPEMTLINDNLCIRINSLSDPPFFLEPIGHHKIEDTINTYFESVQSISRVSEEFINSINKERYKIEELRSQFDYIYKIKDLAEMKGKAYDGKRNHIKKFIKHFPDYKFVPFSEEFNHKALDLFEKWFEIRKDSRFFPKLAHTAQKNALTIALNNFSKLNLAGGATFGGNKLRCFIIGSRLTHDCLSAHFQYCDPEADGASQFTLKEACGSIYSDYELIDLEQDLGIPGLRQAKLSYHPFKVEKKFEVSLLR